MIPPTIDKLRSSAAGFTLIEVLTATIVGAILLAGFTSFYLSEQRAFRQQQIEIETSQGLRIALDQMARDLRAAGLDPTDLAGAGFTVAEPDEVQFTLDENDDGDVDDAGETKGFRKTGDTVETLVGTGLGGWQPLTDGVETLTLTYFDADEVQLPATVTGANLGRIRRVHIVLSMKNNVPGGSITRTEVASARVRNRS